jgi:hypothetical protein
MDTKRSILEKVKDGTLSPEEAAEELSRIERTADEPSAPIPPVPPVPPVPPSGRATRVRIVGDFRTAKITGDSSVAEAVAEGPHTARREGETLVLDASGDFDADDGFTFHRGDRPRVIIGVGSRPKPLVVRMNPDLPLDVSIDAGKISIAGVRAAINGEVDAGAIKVEDVESPFNLSVDAGSVSVAGLMRAGSSTISCDAGSVKVLLRKGSSVRVRARADVGSVRLGHAREKQGFHIGGSSHEAVFGAGEATLDISGSLGRIVVDEA